MVSVTCGQNGTASISLVLDDQPATRIDVDGSTRHRSCPCLEADHASEGSTPLPIRVESTSATLLLEFGQPRVDLGQKLRDQRASVDARLLAEQGLQVDCLVGNVGWRFFDKHQIDPHTNNDEEAAIDVRRFCQDPCHLALAVCWGQNVIRPLQADGGTERVQRASNSAADHQRDERRNLGRWLQRDAHEQRGVWLIEPRSALSATARCLVTGDQDFTFGEPGSGPFEQVSVGRSRLIDDLDRVKPRIC